MIYICAGLLATALTMLQRVPAPTSSPLSEGGAGVAERQRASIGSNSHSAGWIGIWASFAILFVVAGFRYGPGTDFWARYVPIFENVRLGRTVDAEYGYLLINRAIAAITTDYQWLFVVMSLATVGLFYRFIHRMSLDPTLSVYIYVFGGFYLEAFNLVRQGLAIAILLNTVELVLRKKPAAFIVLTMVAVSLHSSALLWFAVWPLIRMRGGRIVRVAVTALLAFMIVAMPGLLESLVTRFAQDYAWYFQSNYGDVRAFDRTALPMAVAIFVGLVVVVRKAGVGDKYLLAIAGLQGVQVVALLATTTVAYAFSRATYYFTPIQIIAVPILLSAIRDDQLRRAVTLIFLLVYGLSFYYKFIVWNSHGVMPYDFAFAH